MQTSSVQKNKFISLNRKQILRIISISFALLCLSYLSTNIKYSLFNDTLVNQIIHAIKQATGKSNSIPDDVVLLNVHYDQYLADAYAHQEKIGSASITDRKIIYDFLTKMYENGSKYNYIFLDIALSEEYTTPWDSLLYDRIRRMERIVIAHSDELPHNMGIANKSGLVDYTSTLFVGGFNKYVLQTMNKPSFALKAYNELGLGNITSFCGLLWFDHGLAVRCITPKVRLNIVRNRSGVENQGLDSFHSGIVRHDILNLGCEVVNGFEDYVDESSDYFEGKNILIGDFTKDWHSTYAGEQTGPSINYNAFLSLVNREHIVKWWQILLIYLVVLYLTFMADIGLPRKPSNIPSLLFFLFNFLIIWILGAMLYWICGQTFDILVVTSTLSVYQDYRKMKSIWKS